MSKATMQKDFDRLANERLHKLVSDIIQLHEIADIEERDAATCILYALFKTAAKVVVWGSLDPSSEQLKALFEKILQATRKATKQNERLGD